MSNQKARKVSSEFLRIVSLLLWGNLPLLLGFSLVPNKPIYTSIHPYTYPPGRRARQIPRFCASATKKNKKTTSTEEEDEKGELDFSDLELFSGGLECSDKQHNEDVDEAEKLAALEEAPIGTLNLDQISFLRNMISCLVAESSSNSDVEEGGETATIVERLLFRLLDEWQAATAEGEKSDEHIERRDALHPTLDDFALVMSALEKEALKYSSSRRLNEHTQEAIDRVLNLFEVLKELWEKLNMEELKPSEQIIESVLRVLASSRERGMDRRVWSLFESIRDGTLYGFRPTCNMYESVIVALAKSRGRGSSDRAEKMLKEAVEKFPPHIDPTTNLRTGVALATFNKVLVSWAKSGEDNGPVRAEQLIVFMDELGEQTKPNLSSFTTLIDAYAQQNDWDGVSYSERIFNRLLDEYFAGEIQEEPNIATWTIVLSAWSRLAKKGFKGTEEKADRLFKRMEALYEEGRISFGPDVIAYIACMNAWAFSKNKFGPTQAELILNEMHEKYMDGDDTMKPSARSIQVVIDSWIKGGDEDSLEQAEQVLDRYEDHLYSLGPPDGPEEVWDDIANIYRTMLFGWSKVDPERAQDYLFDMIDRGMKLDSFSFDKIIEANMQRLPGEPSAMDRINEIFKKMEECRQAGHVQPNERVYTSFIRAMTRSHVKNLAPKAYKVLQRMNELFAEGNKGIRPTVFTYNAVLNACAEAKDTESSGRMKAFKIALEIFNELRTRKRDGLDHVSFGNMLKCANLLPESPQKDKLVSTTFKLCCEKGFVNEFVLRDLQNTASEDVWRSLLECPQGDPIIEKLPYQWRATVNGKTSTKKQTFRRN